MINDGTIHRLVSTQCLGDSDREESASESHRSVLGIPLPLDGVDRVSSFAASVWHGFPLNLACPVFNSST